MGHFVSFDQVSKIYRMGEVTIKAADKISFEIDKGEFLSLIHISTRSSVAGTTIKYPNSRLPSRFPLRILFTSTSPLSLL